MTTHTTHNFKLFIGMLGLVLAAGPANAAVININDYSLVPDGSGASPVQSSDLVAPNGGTVVLPNSGTPVVYFVTTFTFGENSVAKLQVNFAHSNDADRLGVSVNFNGAIDTAGDGNTSNSSPLNLGQNQAGKTLVLLAKLEYNAAYDTTYGAPGTGTSDDTLMNVWVNPTVASVEGSGTSAGDLWTLWNSVNFYKFEQRIFNQSTPATAGTSFITDTVILTGNDATFANALQAAGVPAPAALPAGLAMLGLVATRRRRMS